MTVIAAVIDHEAGRVHMAADSVSSGGLGAAIVSRSKILSMSASDDRVLVAGAGRTAISALVATKVQIASVPGDADGQDRWAQTFASAATEAALAAGLTDGDGARLAVQASIAHVAGIGGPITTAST